MHLLNELGRRGSQPMTYAVELQESGVITGDPGVLDAGLDSPNSVWKAILSVGSSLRCQALSLVTRRR